MGGPHDAAVLQLWHLHSDGAAAKQPPLLFPVDARVLSRSRKLVWRSSGFLKSGSPIVASEATVDATGSEKVFFALGAFAHYVVLPGFEKGGLFLQEIFSCSPGALHSACFGETIFHLRQPTVLCGTALYLMRGLNALGKQPDMRSVPPI